MRRSFILLLVLVLLGCSKAPEPYAWDLPAGVPLPQVPADNPMTKAGVELGRALFYDTALSVNQTQSCGSCHIQHFAFAEPRATSIGATGEMIPRNALALVNVAYNGSLTWAHDGLLHIEQQLLIPLFNESPIEMGLAGHQAEALARLDTPYYRDLFAAAFGEPQPTMNNVVKALASFVRSMVSFNSPFDAYAYRGDDEALTAQQIEGLNLFFSERLECFHCHGGMNFTQSSQHANQQLALKPFHNTGLYNEDGKGAFPISDRGLFDVTLNADDMGRFRAPTLRNISLTAPYMHDGSIATLGEVIDFYAAGGRGAGQHSPLKSPFIKGFSLDDDEREALLAFLRSLTDESFVVHPDFSPPSMTDSSQGR